MNVVHTYYEMKPCDLQSVCMYQAPGLNLGWRLQLIAANLPPEIGRQLTNVCTVRFGTKELSSMFLFVVPGFYCKFAAISCKTVGFFLFV